MNTYKAIVKNNLSGEILEVLEMERARFMKGDFSNIVASMFFNAAQSYYNRDIVAEVQCNDKKCFDISMETERDFYEPSKIVARLTASGNVIRSMVIAD